MEQDVDIAVYFWYVICAVVKCREASENEESPGAGASCSGGDGSTPEKAVAIGGIQSRTESVQAEKKSCSTPQGRRRRLVPPEPALARQ